MRTLIFENFLVILGPFGLCETANIENLDCNIFKISTTTFLKFI